LDVIIFIVVEGKKPAQVGNTSLSFEGGIYVTVLADDLTAVTALLQPEGGGKKIECRNGVPRMRLQ
jgi:hypothetical protein